MQLTITVKDGSTNKDIAAALRFQAGLLEGLSPKKAASRDNTDVDENDDDAEDTDDEELAPTKKSGGKKAKSFDDDEEETDDTESEESDDEDDTEDEEPAPKKKAKKKLTVDDVNEACKARAADTGGKEGRAEVLGILKKKFKTQSVSDLKPEQYADVIKAMAV